MVQRRTEMKLSRREFIKNNAVAATAAAAGITIPGIIGDKQR